MTVTAQHRGLVVVVGATGTLLVLLLAAQAWDGWANLVAHPARAAFVTLLVVVTLVALASPVNLSSGEREDVASRRLFAPSAVGLLALAWVMPFMDRQDRWTLDGDAVRWLGVAAFVVGSVLRIWPMFVLGTRFSGLVAIQPGHELVTDGPYRHVRHPSYLGMMIGFAGWALVFRSAVGLVAVALALPLLVQRIDAEEALLAARFGDVYTAYRRRTWRLLPWVY